MYILKCKRMKTYVTIAPILHPGNPNEESFPVGFAWTDEKAEAVRFTTSYHARAVARAIPFHPTVVRVV
jgi:hypothetical protein